MTNRHRIIFAIVRLVLLITISCIVAVLALIALFGDRHTPIPIPDESPLDVPVTCYAQDYGDRPWPARLEADGTWRCHREDAPPDVPRRRVQ